MASCPGHNNLATSFAFLNGVCDYSHGALRMSVTSKAHTSMLYSKYFIYNLVPSMERRMVNSFFASHSHQDRQAELVLTLMLKVVQLIRQPKALATISLLTCFSMKSNFSTRGQDGLFVYTFNRSCKELCDYSDLHKHLCGIPGTLQFNLPVELIVMKSGSSILFPCT